MESDHLGSKWAWQKVWNRSKKVTILSCWQLITSRRKVTSPAKNSPGNTLTFCSAYSSLPKSAVVLTQCPNLLNSSSTVAYSAPAAYPNEQQSLPSSPYLKVCWLARISPMHYYILFSLMGLARMAGTADCMTVLGMRITLNMPRRRGRQASRRVSEAQRMIHPIRQPGPRYRLVSPEHLKTAISSASCGSTNQAKVGTRSAQVMSSYISSARMGRWCRLLNCRISLLCSADQAAPRGFEGSFTMMNRVLPSISPSISAKDALHFCPACRWQKRGCSPMLLAIVSARGKPGEGKRKLSPSPPSRFMVAQMARLPPAHKNTSSLSVPNAPTANLSTTACRVPSRPCVLVYPSTLPTLLQMDCKFSG